MEGDNPTRRYKWFRPREASRGTTGVQTSLTNWGTITLFNGTSSFYLLLRQYEFVGELPYVAFYRQGLRATATKQSGVTPLIPGAAKLAGDVYFEDEAVQVTAFDWYIPNQANLWWNHEFPFAVVGPNYGICFQNVSQGANTGASLLWESISPDELDYLFW